MSKGNLLLVDDEPLLLKRLKSNLEEYADEIYTAENGIEALKIVKENQIHCIVCDINMPKMNGVQFIKTLREENNNTPLIFYTGHGNKDLMLEAIKYGAFDFLDKPHLEGLEEVIARGMKEGFVKRKLNQKTDDEMISEYHKLLADFENNQ